MKSRVGAEFDIIHFLKLLKLSFTLHWPSSWALGLCKALTSESVSSDQSEEDGSEVPLLTVLYVLDNLVIFIKNIHHKWIHFSNILIARILKWILKRFESNAVNYREILDSRNSGAGSDGGGGVVGLGGVGDEELPKWSGNSDRYKPGLSS